MATMLLPCCNTPTSLCTLQARQLGHAVYNPLHDEHSGPSLAMVAELRHAIAAGELVLHYQPQADLRYQHVYGVEALVRWQHPTAGLLPPADFVPLAERTGVIVPLTAWVLNQALAQCRAWLDAGHDLDMSVNVSLRNLRDPEFYRLVAMLLAHHGVPPARLCLELTESTVMADVEAAQVALLRLRALGVRVSIDDFGTGYSSLAYLARLAVSELKIDRSLVQHMATDEGDATIVASTIGLCRSLGLRIVTEGVETRDTWDLLGALDCDAARDSSSRRRFPRTSWRTGWSSMRPRQLLRKTDLVPTRPTAELVCRLTATEPLPPDKLALCMRMALCPRLRAGTGRESPLAARVPGLLQADADHVLRRQSR